MIREIITDPIFLGLKSEQAGPEDLAAAQDLADTLAAHRDRCIGMAANMIGIRRRIIIFLDGGQPRILFNPVILKTLGQPEIKEEGCLCHSTVRPTRRWPSIKVAWLDLEFKKKIKTFTGLEAQIIQHEIDHCDGILI